MWQRSAKREPGTQLRNIKRLLLRRPKLAAKLTDPKSGRSVKVLTTAPGMQFYSGNFIEGVHGKGGAVYNKHAGVCLETQGFPNAVNEHAFPSVILGPGERYRHEVDYQFSNT